MRTKTKVWLTILGVFLVAAAVLLTIYWKQVSDFCVDTWNKITNKQETTTEEIAPTPAPEDSVELTIKYDI